MAERFYISEPVQGNTVQIGGPEARHIAKVMRKRVGDELILFDGTGTEYRARIDGVSKEAVDLTVLATEQGMREASVGVTLCVAIPKGDRMEQLIRGCCELGARRIIPLLAERTVASGGSGGSAKRARWERVAVEASKQSGRTAVCELLDPVTLEEAIGAVGREPLLLYGATEAGAPFIGDRLRAAEAGPVALFIGPEGGFTDAECDRLRAAGAVGVSLGPTILRIETAAVAMLAMLLGLLGRGRGGQ